MFEPPGGTIGIDHFRFGDNELDQRRAGPLVGLFDGLGYFFSGVTDPPGFDTVGFGQFHIVGAGDRGAVVAFVVEDLTATGGSYPARRC